MDTQKAVITEFPYDKQEGVEALSFTPESVAVPDEFDVAIAGEITALFARGLALSGMDNSVGSALHDGLRRPQKGLLPALLANMLRNGAGLSCAVADPAAAKAKILYTLETCFEFTRLHGMEPLLYERNWGNPFGLQVGGKVLALDSPSCYYFAEKLAESAAHSARRGIVEIGGGYGGVAFALRPMCPPVPYVVIDAFESCLLQYYFLRKAGRKVTLALDPARAPEPDAVTLVPAGLADDFLPKLTDAGILFSSGPYPRLSGSIVEHGFSLMRRRRPAGSGPEGSNFLFFPNFWQDGSSFVALRWERL